MPTPFPQWINSTKSNNFTTKYPNKSSPNSPPNSLNTKLMPPKLIFPLKWTNSNATNSSNNSFNPVSTHESSIPCILSSLSEENYSGDSSSPTSSGMRSAVKRLFKLSTFWLLSLWKIKKPSIKKTGSPLCKPSHILWATSSSQVFSTVRPPSTRQKITNYSKSTSTKTVSSQSSSSRPNKKTLITWFQVDSMNKSGSAVSLLQRTPKFHLNFCPQLKSTDLFWACLSIHWMMGTSVLLPTQAMCWFIRFLKISWPEIKNSMKLKRKRKNVTLTKNL